MYKKPSKKFNLKVDKPPGFLTCFLDNTKLNFNAARKELIPKFLNRNCDNILNDLR